MKGLFEKLNRQNGASMLLAMVLLMVCTMVGAVILSSAAGNLDKLKKRSAEQQEYLALRSAAELIRDALGQTEFTAWERKYVYACVGYPGEIRPPRCADYPEVCTQMGFAEGDAGLRAELAELLYTAYRSHTKYYPQTAIAQQPEREFLLSSTQRGLPPVRARLRLDAQSYEAVFSLSIAEDAVSDYAMTLRLQPTVHSPEPNSAEEIVEVLQNADGAHEVLETVTNSDGTTEQVWLHRDFDITTYTLNTSIRYDSGKITKGVLADETSL